MFEEIHFRLWFPIQAIILNWEFGSCFFSTVVGENNNIVMLIIFISGNHANLVLYLGLEKFSRLDF